jgi:hypothetical protein
MNSNEIKRIIFNDPADLAFIVGNGINLYYRENNLSWKDLLLDLWSRYSKSNQTSIPGGISFTEFYDALEISNFDKDNFSSVLQNEVKEIMKNWRPGDGQSIVLNKIKEFNAPIITPNFDDLIPKSLNLNFFKIKDSSFTDYYPWSCYYSDKELEYSTQGFGVWFPHGMIKYHRSIKLGLSQYMGNVERARKLIHNGYDNISFEGKNKNYWEGYKTWLHIIFNKSIIIFGFGFDENEVFLRWLLIERAKYYKKFPNRMHKGWYITHNNSNDKNLIGKKFFMKSVGFEIIEADDFPTIYDKIWK